MSGPLLVVDGDSFAHRSYHALPKSIRRADGGPAGLLAGVGNLLVRLWEEERPRAVVVCWDTLTVPTSRLPTPVRSPAGPPSARRIDFGSAW